VILRRFALQAMATRFELVLEGRSEASLLAIAEEAFDEIRLGEACWSLFRRGSLLAKVNREAASRPVRLDEATWGLLELSLELSRASNGAFDPTLAPLMRAHGFHEREGAPGEPRWGAEHVHLDAGARTVRFDLEGIELDLGGIAKGFALDLAAQVLREHGVERALLHGGTSSVVAIGAPPDREGWEVALSPEEGAPRAVLRDGALAVSASHGREVEEDGASLGHVLDPASGDSARGALAAAVLAPSAGVADGWSTAVLAAGGRALELPPECQARVRLDRPDARWTPLASGERAQADSRFQLPYTTLESDVFRGALV